MTRYAPTDVQTLEPGSRYWDPVGGAVVLVLRAAAFPGLLRCNGMAMVRSGPMPCSYHSGRRAYSYLRPGGRYLDVFSGLEVRCLRGGYGQLTYAHRILAVA